MCGTAWWSLCDIWPNRTMWWSSQRSAGWTVRAAVHAWLRCAPRRIWRVTSWRLKPRRPLSRCATDRGVKKRARRRRREPSDVLWFCLSVRVKASSADSAERSLAKPSVFCSLLFLNTFKSKQLKWHFDSCVCEPSPHKRLFAVCRGLWGNTLWCSEIKTVTCRRLLRGTFSLTCTFTSMITYVQLQNQRK